MVLPGIQALFGFQLVAVFNTVFHEQLSPTEQGLHLLATALVAVAIALIMTPAAYHRQTGMHDITQRFIDISTHLMLVSVVPLASSICLEIYLISRIILHSVSAAVAIALGLFGLFGIMWFAFPRIDFLQRLFDSRR
jgi:hypothetical protein